MTPIIQMDILGRTTSGLDNAWSELAVHERCHVMSKGGENNNITFVLPAAGFFWGEIRAMIGGGFGQRKKKHLMSIVSIYAQPVQVTLVYGLIKMLWYCY